MTFDPLTISVCVLAIIILGLSKGGFAGIGMVSMPLMSLVVEPTLAAGIILPVLIFQDAISAYAYRKTFSARNIKIMLPTAIIGILVGAKLVSSVDRGIFEIVLGVVSTLFGSERIFRQFNGPPKPHKSNPVVGMICGALAGFTSMIAHAGVPPFQFFVLPQRLERDMFVGTSVVFYAAVNWIKLPFFLSLGQISYRSFMISLALFPLAFLAVLAGIWLVRRIPTEKFITVANGILIFIGVMLIWRGMTA